MAEPADGHPPFGRAQDASRQLEKGRFEVFLSYHLRVGEITANTHVRDGHSLRQQRLNETEVGETKAATLTELAPVAGEKPVGADFGDALGLPTVGTDGLVDQETFESIYNPGKALLLAFWKNGGRG